MKTTKTKKCGAFLDDGKVGFWCWRGSGHKGKHGFWIEW